MAAPLSKSGCDAHALASALDLAQDCQRRLRCCLAALRLHAATELCELIDTSRRDPAAHILAPVTAGSNCQVCGRTADARHGCRHRRSHMQSTKNSKRSVHTYLKWMALLGPNFPVTDTMLQESFWKNLDPTCEYGVRKENGHAKRPGQPVCINPFHYNVINSERVTAMLLQELEPFYGVVPAFRRAASLARLGPGSADPGSQFALLIRHLRAAVEELPFPISPLTTTPRSPPPERENDYEAFLHFVAQAGAEDLGSLEVRAVMTMTAITPHRAACSTPC